MASTSQTNKITKYGTPQILHLASAQRQFTASATSPNATSTKKLQPKLVLRLRCACPNTLAYHCNRRSPQAFHAHPLNIHLIWSRLCFCSLAGMWFLRSFKGFTCSSSRIFLRDKASTREQNGTTAQRYLGLTSNEWTKERLTFLPLRWMMFWTRPLKSALSTSSLPISTPNTL